METKAAPDARLESIRELAKGELKKLAGKIDREGFYPQHFLHSLGECGGFGSASDTTAGGAPSVDLVRQFESIAAVGKYCGSTAFLTWCQSASAWYLQHARVEATRNRYLGRVASGKALSGTGMSNAVKHLAGIERIHLKAQRCADGYTIRGTLPWVSNVDRNNLLTVTAEVNTGGYVMFIVEGNTTDLDLRPCPEFSGMEGTATYSIHFRDVSIEADQVIAHPDQFEAFMQRIKPGFIIGQSGMGLGVIDGCLQRIRESNLVHADVNQFLDDQEAVIQPARDELYARGLKLAGQAQQGTASVLDALKLRAAVSELTLRAANSAVLHAGARGYLMRDSAQRQLREAVFVGIVTPALKHLRKEIHDIENARACA
ncbi:MAG TPA: acyl-CoA dehydrogenase family protein [Marinobacter sp.]|nr:acyl-CoA dehydrogenase family protein [Marinobacter sp.]